MIDALLIWLSSQASMKAEEFSERLWEFAVGVARVVDALPDTRVGRHVAGQLVRCGTAPAPNYDEACSGESKADFAHKIGIATKEMRETRGWLRFVVKLEMQPPTNMNPLIDESEELLKMLVSSFRTAKGLRKPQGTDTPSSHDSQPED
jgi:four helix bundle protein